MSLSLHVHSRLKYTRFSAQKCTAQCTNNARTVCMHMVAAKSYIIMRCQTYNIVGGAGPFKSMRHFCMFCYHYIYCRDIAQRTSKIIEDRWAHKSCTIFADKGACRCNDAVHWHLHQIMTMYLELPKPRRIHVWHPFPCTTECTFPPL